MKVVYNWLKDFVDVAASPQELASRLALSGTNIGGVENGAHGAVIEAEVSSNRPDCLGHYGMAREVAAIYKLPLKHVSPKPVEGQAKAGEAVKVEIQSPELCGRVTARVIRNVKIQPSPKWLKDRLEASGVSSISNVVDVSNYVMLELGHALHAFDYDGSRSIGIGGIMGGAETEISFSTKNVLIECAWFDPVAVRRASRSLKLHTEASLRFGRGADPEMAELASRRSAELILELAGGELLAGVVDVYPGKRAPEKIRVTRAEILRVMGADVPDKQIEASLSALGFAPVRVDHNRGAEGSLLAAWECAQPSWRAEVEREIDLIEEIARIYGLDKFPPRLPAARQGAARLPQGEAETRLRQRLIGLGYREIVTIPHVAEERDALFRPAGVSPARLSNPLSEEANVLRSTGIVTMAAALEWNLNHGQRDARLFEIGRHYRLKENRPVETSVLTIGATGEAREKSLYESPRDYSFADLKGALDEIGQLADGRDVQGFQWRDEGPEWLHPGKRGKIQLGNVELGMAGQLTRRIADLLKFRQGVFLAEIELAPLYSAMQSAKTAQRYVTLPRFPSVQRDFSLLLAEGISFAQISQSIRSLNIQEITSIEAVDLFRGKNVPAGKYSLLVRVTFQSREATLTDAQINHFEDKIISTLKHRQGAQLRAS